MAPSQAQGAEGQRVRGQRVGPGVGVDPQTLDLDPITLNPNSIVNLESKAFMLWFQTKTLNHLPHGVYVQGSSLAVQGLGLNSSGLKFRSLRSRVHELGFWVQVACLRFRV
mmetsp:Transcript_25029/g.39316  ORF Transcript_25029/g.39316 Transcript_25029/m.39316 type:complete len:111 (+) Transcript_25029:777-1109(+)